MPSFGSKQHVLEVNKELLETVQKLGKKSKLKLIKLITKTVETLKEQPTNTPEGANIEQIDPCPDVTTTYQ